MIEESKDLVWRFSSLKTMRCVLAGHDGWTVQTDNIEAMLMYFGLGMTKTRSHRKIDEAPLQVQEENINDVIYSAALSQGSF